MISSLNLGRIDLVFSIQQRSSWATRVPLGLVYMDGLHDAPRWTGLAEFSLIGHLPSKVVLVSIGISALSTLQSCRTTDTDGRRASSWYFLVKHPREHQDPRNWGRCRREYTSFCYYFALKYTNRSKNYTECTSHVVVFVLDAFDTLQELPQGLARSDAKHGHQQGGGHGFHRRLRQG